MITIRKMKDTTIPEQHLVLQWLRNVVILQSPVLRRIISACVAAVSHMSTKLRVLMSTYGHTNVGSCFYNESVLCDEDQFYPMSELVISREGLEGKILRKFRFFSGATDLAVNGVKRLLFINWLKWVNFSRSEHINGKFLVKHFD